MKRFLSSLNEIIGGNNQLLFTFSLVFAMTTAPLFMATIGVMLGLKVYNWASTLILIVLGLLMLYVGSIIYYKYAREFLLRRNWQEKSYPQSFLLMFILSFGFMIPTQLAVAFLWTLLH